MSILIDISKLAASEQLEILKKIHAKHNLEVQSGQVSTKKSRKSPSFKTKRSDAEKQKKLILDFLRTTSGSKPSQIEEATGMNNKIMHSRLQQLLKEGRVSYFNETWYFERFDR